MGDWNRQIFQQNRQSPFVMAAMASLLNDEWRHCPPFGIFLFFSSRVRAEENRVINAHLWVLYLPNAAAERTLPYRAHPRGPLRLRHRLIQVQEHFALVHIRWKCTALSSLS